MSPLRLLSIVVPSSIALASFGAPGYQGPNTFVAPPDSGVINVQSYGATPDDSTDDTAAIQAAIDAFPGTSRIIYLPDGVYKISNTLEWPDDPALPDSRKDRLLSLVGQSTDGVTLQIPNNHPSFNNASSPRAVINTGLAPAQRFGNSIKTLTVDVGSNNPGAIGIQFNASNRGILRDVVIRAGGTPRKGAIGLDLRFTPEVGPLMVRNLMIEGFDIGIHSQRQTNGQTFEHIELRYQNIFAFKCQNAPIFVRGLKTIGEVTAISNSDNLGFVVLTDSSLQGVGNASSLSGVISGKNSNNTRTFLQDVAISGFGDGIEQKFNNSITYAYPNGNYSHWSSNGTVQLYDDAISEGLNIPVEEMPQPPQIALSNWVSVTSKGAVAGDGIDDTAAIQAAIDDANSQVVYFPNIGSDQNSSYTINGTVHLRGNVVRLTGFEGILAGSGKIIVENGSAPTVFVDNLMKRIGPSGGSLQWEVNTTRTTVISHVGLEGQLVHKGTGALFLEDTAGSPIVLEGGPVFARQLNVEDSATMVTVDATTAWILGMKTEKGGINLHAKNNAVVELMGLLAHPAGAPSNNPNPMILIENSRLTGSFKEPTFSGLNRYPVKVREVRGNETRDLLQADVPSHYVSFFSGAADVSGGDTGSPMHGWNMNGNGSDSGPLGANLNLQNGALFTADSVEGSHSLKLDGVDDFASLSLDLPSQITFTAWMKLPAAATGNNVILANRGLNYQNAGMILRLTSSRIELNSSNGASSAIGKSIPNSVSYDNQWQHIAVVVDRDAGEVHFYKNGAPVTEANSNFIKTDFPMSGNFKIGRPDNNTDHFQGQMDDVRIYNSLLTESQIFAQAGGSLSIPDPAQQVVRWLFDNNGVDASGNGNDLNFLSTFTPTYSSDRIEGTQSIDLPGTSKVGGVSLDPGNSFSIATWVQIPTTTSGSQVLLSNKGTSSKADGFVIRLNGNRVEFQAGNGTTSLSAFSDSGTVDRDGQWHHLVVAVNRNSGECSFYWDGISVGDSVATRDDFTTNGISFGSPGNNTQFFQGKVDDFRIYSITLNGSEANALFLE